MGSDGQKIRALLVAESCNPEFVSIPLEGWSLASRVAALTDAHLVTQIRNAPAITRAGWSEGDEFSEIDSEAVASAVHRLAGKLRGGSNKGWTTLLAMTIPSHMYFDRIVWRRFGERIKAGEWDVVHRITPQSPAMPCLLADKVRAAGVPFVAGPLNGGLPWPEGFNEVKKAEKEWLTPLRGATKVLPGFKGLRTGAAALVVGSGDAARQMPADVEHKEVYIPSNAVDRSRFPYDPSRATHPGPGEPLRIVYVGRLVPYKGADMLLEGAAPAIRSGAVVVDIIGSGPEHDRLVQMAEDLDIAHGVTMHGQVAHTELHTKLAAGHIFGFPSVREFGGTVVLEAMALGVVPLCIAYGGPGEHVTTEVGFPIAHGSRGEIVSRVTAALADILADPSQLAELSRAGNRRIDEFYTWERKAEMVHEVYRWVLGRRDKPDWGLPLGNLDRTPL